MATVELRAALVALSIFLLLAGAHPLGADGPVTDPDHAERTVPPATPDTLPPEPFVPPDHWSRNALRRLVGAGILKAEDVGTAWPLPRDRVRRHLLQALDATGDKPGRPTPAPHGLAAALLHRFEAEYPAPDAAGALHAAGRVDGGWHEADGQLRGGTHERADDGGWIYTGPVPVPARASASAAAEVEATSSGGVGIRGDLRFRPGGLRAREAYGFLRTTSTALWLGRRHLALGPPTGRGLVLSGQVPFDGGGVHLVEGVRFPGFLRHLGPVRGSTALARLERSGQMQQPWFWAARLSVAPRHDLVVGLNRAAIFGGEGNEPVNFRNVGLMLLGFTSTRSKSSDFENQVASADVMWQTRVRSLPLLIHGEWGFSDVGGAWFRVPGIVMGLQVPAVGRLPQLALGTEYASFSRSGGGHPPWYRHGPLGEGWTDRGRILGHPLGGHGREWSASLQVDPLSLPASGTLRVFHRRRGEENLLARDGPETSTGAVVRMRIHGPNRFLLHADAGWESGRPDRGGEGWRAWTLRVSAGLGF